MHCFGWKNVVCTFYKHGKCLAKMSRLNLWMKQLLCREPHPELLGKTGKAPYVSLYLSFAKAWAAGFIEKRCFALYTQMAILKYQIPAFIFWWPDGFTATAHSKTQHDQWILEIAGLTEPRPDELLSFLLRGGLFSFYEDAWQHLSLRNCPLLVPPISSKNLTSNIRLSWPWASLLSPLLLASGMKVLPPGLFALEWSVTDTSRAPGGIPTWSLNTLEFILSYRGLYDCLAKKIKPSRFY